MGVSSRDKLRGAIGELFGVVRDPEPPRRITIAPSADLFRRVTLLADKLGQSWNATACMLMDAAADEAFDLLDNELHVHLGKQVGMSSEQAEDFKALDRGQQDEVLSSMAEWSSKPADDSGPFTHPLLREAQMRDEHARQILAGG